MNAIIKITKDIDFKNRFNAYRNNAYGLSCENYQYAFFRPKIKSRYIPNLYYCGQTSCPGPGVPPSMVSGLNSSNLLLKTHEEKEKEKEKKNNYYLSRIQYIFTEFWIIITNLIVNLITFGFNLLGLKTSIICLSKEINYTLFGKLKPNYYFKYE